MPRKNNKPIEHTYLMTEGEIREEIHRLMWELGVSRLLNEYAGANDAVRELTIQMADRIKELRPITSEKQFIVNHPTENTPLYVYIMDDAKFFDLFGYGIEANYDYSKHAVILKKNRINAEDWLSYIFDMLMHEFGHTIQFKGEQQVIDYNQKTRGDRESLEYKIGYAFNPYEIGTRVQSADFYFRAFIEGSGLKPEQLREIPYKFITDNFNNSLLLDDMEKLMNEVASLPTNDATAMTLKEICTRLTQSAKAKAENVYNSYLRGGDVEKKKHIAKMKNIALNTMRKHYNDYVERLQKLWECLITDYNGKKFNTYYIH